MVRRSPPAHSDSCVAIAACPLQVVDMAEPARIMWHTVIPMLMLLALVSVSCQVSSYHAETGESSLVACFVRSPCLCKLQWCVALRIGDPLVCAARKQRSHGCFVAVICRQEQRRQALCPSCRIDICTGGQQQRYARCRGLGACLRASMQRCEGAIIRRIGVSLQCSQDSNSSILRFRDMAFHALPCHVPPLPNSGRCPAWMV